MYDELERAYGGRSRRGPSVLGWILIGLAVFFVLGVAGVAFAFRVVQNEVQEFAEQLEGPAAAGVSAAVAGLVAQALADVEPELLAADPEIGRAILANIQAGSMDEAELRDLIEGSLRIRTEEGEVRADLRGNEEGGSLVIQTPDGDVRVDLVRDEAGGELVIEAEGETLRFGAGESARGAPDWVPVPDGMPERTREGFSASAAQGLFGVAAWETERSPESVVEPYRARLESDGYDLQAEHSHRAGEGRSASVVGRDETSGRMVFLAASREDGVTKVVLGWGEGVDG
jgi:hypothetical protein